MTDRDKPAREIARTAKPPNRITFPVVSTPEGKSAIAFVAYARMEWGLTWARIAAMMGVRPRSLKRFVVAAIRHYGATAKGITQ